MKRNSAYLLVSKSHKYNREILYIDTGQQGIFEKGTGHIRPGNAREHEIVQEDR